MYVVDSIKTTMHAYDEKSAKILSARLKSGDRYLESFQLQVAPTESWALIVLR